MINRFEIIDKDGRQYTNHKVEDITYLLQDDERTLKVFINQPNHTKYLEVPPYEKYNLIKMSEPGYSLRCDNIERVKQFLELSICKDCAKIHQQVNVEAEVYELLNTHCGAEFVLEEE